MTLATKALCLSLAALPLALAVPALAPPAHAQTSFGKISVAPTNAREWEAAAHAQLLNSVRRANSSLAMQGAVGNIRALLAIAITPDGRIVDVQVMHSTGRASLDQALIRALSRTDPLTPFTPDMKGELYIHTLGLGVRSG